MTSRLRFVEPAPKIKHVMTPFPFFIQTNATVADALTMMEVQGIHHLPVQHDGELVGIVSDHDLARATSRRDPIAEVMRSDVFVVDMEHPLDAVLEMMMKERLGSALIRHDDKLAGIFTTFDACRLLLDAFEPSGPVSGDDVA